MKAWGSLAVAAVILAGSWAPACVTERATKAQAMAPLRGEALHLTLRAETHTPTVGQQIVMTGEVRGTTLGRGNEMCLTPWWTVDAVDIPFPGEEKCGSERWVFRHAYTFTNPGPYVVLLAVKTRRGQVIDFRTARLDVEAR